MTNLGIICFTLVFLIIVGWLLNLFIALTGGWGITILVLLVVGMCAKLRVILRG